MAEEIRDDLTSILIEKKKGAWGDEGCLKYNFTLPSELTVTITLDEYRALIKHDATRNEVIEKKDKECMDYYFENEKLKKENASLKEKQICDGRADGREEGEGGRLRNERGIETLPVLRGKRETAQISDFQSRGEVLR